VKIELSARVEKEELVGPEEGWASISEQWQGTARGGFYTCQLR